MKNFIFGFLIAITIAIVGIGGYMYGKQQNKIGNLPTSTPSPTSAAVSPTGPSVGNDTDEHGCKGSAGYTWCEIKNKCLRTWEESCTAPTVAENVAEAIKQALVKKHNWNSNEIEVTVSKNDGTYASGGVKEKASEVGGGYFFAAKVNGVWNIVADGNGTISCDSLIPYPNYPVSLIPVCFNEKTGLVIKR